MQECPEVRELLRIVGDGEHLQSPILRMLRRVMRAILQMSKWPMNEVRTAETAGSTIKVYTPC